MDDISTALEILAYMVFGDMHKLAIILNFFELEDADIQTILGPLASVFGLRSRFKDDLLSPCLSPGLSLRQITLHSLLYQHLTDPLCISWFEKARSGRFNELPLREYKSYIKHYYLTLLDGR